MTSGKVMNDVGRVKIYPWELIHDPPDPVNDPSDSEKCWRHGVVKLAPCLSKLAPCL